MCVCVCGGVCVCVCGGVCVCVGVIKLWPFNNPISLINGPRTACLRCQNLNSVDHNYFNNFLILCKLRKRPQSSLLPKNNKFWLQQNFRLKNII